MACTKPRYWLILYWSHIGHRVGTRYYGVSFKTKPDLLISLLFPTNFPNTVLQLIHSHFRLKPVFANSADLLDLSSQFVMVNSEDDEEPSSDSSFSLDGGYIPRIIFLDSTGSIRSEFSNKARSDKYRYFYSTAQEIVVSMNEVLENIGGISEGQTDEKNEL